MKNNKGIALILIVLIIIGFLLIVGGIYYFWTKKIQKPIVCSQEAKVCPDGSTVGRTEPNCEFAPCPSTKSSETTDCKTDFNCFIEESKNCNPSKVINTTTTDILGVKQTTTSSFEIKGIELEKCIFYLRTERIGLTFPSGTSQEIINQQKEISKKLEGRDGTCKFKIDDLTAMLTRWKNGNLSSDDFNVAECNGTFFERQL